MNLSNRERFLLVLDESVWWSRSFFDDVNYWIDCKCELKHYYVKHHVQTKAREKEKLRLSDSNNNSDEHTETDKNDGSSEEADVDSRFVFARIVPDISPMQKQNTIEWKKTSDDVIVAKTEFKRASANCIDHNVK